MFGRALKYDMKAVWKLWWIIAVSVAALTVISSFVMRFVISMADKLEYASSLLSVVWGFAVLFLVMSIVVIFASSIGTVILVLVRFYKNFFTDEGYLTFTLPVSRAKLFFAKITNAMIWTLLHNVLLTLCVMLMLLIAPPPDNGAFINPIIYRGIGEFLTFIFEIIGTEGVLWILLYMIEGMILLFISSLINVCLLHLCITVGAVIAKKAKVIAGIGIYYGVNILFSTILSIFGNLFTVGMMGGFIEIMSSIGSGRGVMSIIAVMILFAIAIFATVAVSLYLATLDMIRNKLNLA